MLKKYIYKKPVDRVEKSTELFAIAYLLVHVYRYYVKNKMNYEKVKLLKIAYVYCKN